MKKIFSKLAIMCTMLTMLSPIKVLAEDNSYWVIDFGNGYNVNVWDLAEENSVDPYELRQAVLEDMESDIFAPFSKVDSFKLVPLPNETVEYVTNTKTRSVQTIARKENQTATAYTGDSGVLTASNKTPAVGMCAMDIDVTTKTGTTTSEIVRLGTRLYLDDFIDVNGTSLSSLVVEDRGSGRSSWTTYWIDVCFGTTSSATESAALNFGNQTISYSYIY